MTILAQLPRGTRIEFLKFDDWKRYADANGFWMDRPATRTGYCSMINGFPLLRPDVSMPRDFQYEVVPSST